MRDRRQPAAALACALALVLGLPALAADPGPTPPPSGALPAETAPLPGEFSEELPAQTTPRPEAALGDAPEETVSPSESPPEEDPEESLPPPQESAGAFSSEPSPPPDVSPGPEPAAEAAPAPPVVQVTVPASGRVTVNPYGLRVCVDGNVSTDQVLCPTQFIVNSGETAVSVSAAATGIPGGETVLLEAPPEPNTREKALFLYLELLESPDGQSSPAWAPAFTDAGSQLVVNDGTSAKADMLILGPGVPSPAYGAFRLSGCAAGAPIRPWTSADTADVTLCFTFTPV